MTETAVNPYAQVMEANGALLRALTAQANEKVAKVKASENVNETISDLLKESDDEKVVKYREFVDTLENKLLAAEREMTEYVKANLLPQDNDAVDVEAETAAYKELRDQINGFRKLLSQLPGGPEFLESLPTLDSLGRGGGSGGGPTGRKPRVTRAFVANAKSADDKTEVFQEHKNEDGTVDRKVSLTIVAQHLSKLSGTKVDPSTIRDHADEVVGTDWKSRNGEPFDFAMAVGDENYIVTLTPSE